MFEHKDSLPGAELHPAVCHGDGLATTAENHPDVRSGVIRPFGGMNKIVGILRHKSFEVRFEIHSRRAIRIFKNDQTGARVLDKNRHDSRFHTAGTDDLLHLPGNFVGTLTACGNFEDFGMSGHFARIRARTGDPSSPRSVSPHDERWGVR